MHKLKYSNFKPMALIVPTLSAELLVSSLLIVSSLERHLGPGSAQDRCSARGGEASAPSQS